MFKLMKTQSHHETKLANLKASQEAQYSLEQTIKNTKSNIKGLRESDAEKRLLENGYNNVAREKVTHPLIQLCQAFNNPFIYVLMALAAVSFYTDYLLPDEGEEADATGIIIIVVMILLSGLMRFWQEYRSGKAAESLKCMVSSTATVSRRDDNTGERIEKEIAMQELVVGDIIRLSAGDMVPADIRLINSRDLFISQAVLTGEALPVEKYDTMGSVTAKTASQEIVSSDTDTLNLSTFCFMGTSVVSGHATAIVIATGSDTYFGSLAKTIVGTRSQTAFDKGVNSVSWLLIRFMAIMVPIVFLISGFTKGEWADAFMFSLAIAVGLTPEMLPMIVSANLAKGAIAMAQRKVVVKRLNAIQNFGAMDILCTDKTGTLTQDRIILERHVDTLGRCCEDVLRLAWLNSSHQSGMKNLLDQAVVYFAKENIEDSLPKHINKVDELPFDFVRRRLSVVVSEDNNKHTIICKGAVEETLSVCSHIKEEGKLVPLDEKRKKRLMTLAQEYNSDGFRVLAVAVRDLTEEEKKEQYTHDIETNLTLEGYLTFLDPPKETAAPSIASLHAHGVAVKVLTGDTPVITCRVCREVGIQAGTPVLGHQIEEMEDTALTKVVEEHTVFAKLTPTQKSRIITILQQNGHTVGFLGDGINDAPALKAADVGISVDTATDIAKESADIILLEKSLMVLEEGVIMGRQTFGNIIKYLNMTASSNFGNVFSVLVASAFIPFLPMLAIHLLIQNLMYDVSQFALPWDHMDKEFLEKPRKWDAPNIGRFMVWIGPTSSIFDITTYALMWFVFGANSVDMQSLFQSGWFVEGLLSQTLVAHMLRTRKIPFIQSTAALPLLLMTTIIMVLGVYIPFSSFGAMVGLVPLPWDYFPWLIGTLLLYCVVAQTMKTIYLRRFGQWF